LLDYLKWTSLLAAGFALIAHVASFVVPVNDNVLQVGLMSLAVLAAVCAMFSFFPSHTETHTDGDGTTISLTDAAWRYVPWWLHAPAGITMLYGAIGLAYQVPGVHEFSVIDMTPVVARWACVFDASIFLIAAALYQGCARMREKEFL
jgi:hypothetical protein